MDSNGRQFDGSQWYLRIMDSRTRAALRQQDEEFIRQHADDTEEQLLAWVAYHADRLGHAPQMCEVPGAGMIGTRFGSWRAALRRVGHPAPEGTPELRRSRRYREEYARQQELYRAEKREKTEKRMKRKKNV